MISEGIKVEQFAQISLILESKLGENYHHQSTPENTPRHTAQTYLINTCSKSTLKAVKPNRDFKIKNTTVKKNFRTSFLCPLDIETNTCLLDIETLSDLQVSCKVIP